MLRGNLSNSKLSSNSEYLFTSRSAFLLAYLIRMAFPWATFAFTLLSRIVAISLALLVFRALHQIIYNRFFHPLSAFPGPFWASVTRLWGAYHDLKGDWIDLEWEELKKHGILLHPELWASKQDERSNVRLTRVGKPKGPSFVSRRRFCLSTILPKSQRFIIDTRTNRRGTSLVNFQRRTACSACRSGDRIGRLGS